MFDPGGDRRVIHRVFDRVFAGSLGPGAAGKSQQQKDKQNDKLFHNPGSLSGKIVFG